jgi:mannitol/fructose-specific phosphotransferase system IIA component (Ntr-type)
LPGLTRPIGAFARLDPPQDFEALDNRPADLVFMLLSPPDRERRSLESAGANLALSSACRRARGFALGSARRR